MKLDAKEIASLLRTLSKTANTHRFTSAVIAAAGAGTRMNADRTKQLLTLDGVPVIVRTLLAFESCPVIDEIIVAARADELGFYGEFREKYALKKLAAVIEGGETRQESVLKGFEAVSGKCEFVAIHDGARCLITPEQIEKVVRAAYNHGAATACCHVSDTVKRVNTSGFIEETIDRDTLMLAQTPQVFKTELYRAAAYVAKEDGFTATDDNMLAEHIGFPVKYVDCGKSNLKLTTPDDLAVAEILLKAIPHNSKCVDAPADFSSD